MPRAAPHGSARSEAYHHLGRLKREGWIQRYQASQAPNGQWGFRLTMPDRSEYWMLPREAIAFATGIQYASNPRTRDTATEPIPRALKRNV